MSLHPVSPDAEVRCPLCGVLMVYSAKARIWHCPIRNCRGVFMVPEPAEVDYASPEEMFHDLSQPPGAVKRGGGDKAGRKRKKPSKRWYRRDEDK